MSKPPATFSAPYRVRFDEAGPDGRLRTSVLLRYAQDVAWHHSEHRGYDRAWYAERGLAWLVRTAEVDVLEPIQVGSELVATTRVVGWRRVWARRRTEFHDATQRLVASAQIDWVLLDRRGAPTRIPAEFEVVFSSTDGNVTLARVSLDDPPPGTKSLEVVVRPQELDPMIHVNNAVYGDWLEEAVAARGGDGLLTATPRRMRLEYAVAADLGARLVATAWQSGDGWSYLLRDGAGQVLLRARLEPCATS